MTHTLTTPQERLDRYGYNAIARQLFLSLMTTVPLFLGANTLAWGWGWALTVLTILGWAGLSLYVARANPALLNKRGKRTRDMTGTKGWDWPILALYFLLLLVLPLVAGLDYRYGWSAPVPAVVNVVGLVLVAAGFVLLAWSMAVNRFFEGTVRILPEGGQHVTTDGPYRYVRHPGYAALLLGFIGSPLALGTWVAFIPALALVVVFIVRTALEDSALRRELPGYADYAARTRLRLLPGVW